MAEPIEVYRGSVNTWDCDMMGHMNVQFYVDKASDALLGLGQALGLGPEFVRANHAQLVAGDHHIRFLREQRPGAPIHVLGAILGIESQALHVYLEMRNTASGAVAATFVGRFVLRSNDRQEIIRLPDFAVAAAETLHIERPEYAAPRGLRLLPPRPAPMLVEAQNNGMTVTYRGVVKAAMCDHGVMATRAYMGVVSDAVPNILAEINQLDRSGSRVGGAALEYRLIYHQAPRAGDLIVLYTGITDIGSKAYRFCHWMFNATGGAAVATAEAVAIALDLDARKAVEIPDGLRRALQRVIVPGLGV